MSWLEQAVSLKDLPSSQLWVLYGKSGAGKTHMLSTFPKPMLYLQFGDDGSNTIGDVEGIDVMSGRIPTL